MTVPSHFANGLHQLHDEASASTGLDNFGDPGYLDALQTLLNAYDETALFSPSGRFQTWAMLVNCLRGRLYATSYIEASMAAARALRQPIFIVGLPRTGTTLLHRLLCSLPQYQGLEYWLGCFPQPRPARRDWEGNPRFQEVRDNLAMLDHMAPDMKHIHEMQVDAVDECRLLLMQSFVNVTFQSNATIPTYAEFLYDAAMGDAYRLYARTLAMIGANSDQRWILKDPSHLWAMDQLFATFPDAIVIQTHRDPVKLIPSVASLVFTARRITEPAVTAKQVGQAELHQWHRVLENALEVRKKHPDRFIDLDFTEFVRDPVAGTAELCRKLCAEPDPEKMQTLRRWIASNPQHKHGTHQYQPGDFGLEENEINELFAEYRAFYGV